jgi:hypothetical protein
LTDKDIADLATVVDIADVVDVSFVQDSSEIIQLIDTLHRFGGDHLGVVLKIETKRAFEHLPQLLLTAMRRPRIGVMIARGDLAVEVGYERMAELQEEILWLCEAAHLPAIWATQVLEQLAKNVCRPAPKSAMPQWVNAPNASCSTRDRTFRRRCACSTTFCKEWRNIKARNVRCSAICAWRITWPCEKKQREAGVMSPGRCGVLNDCPGTRKRSCSSSSASRLRRA